MVLLCRVSHCAGMFGPMGMDLRSSRTDARGLLDGRAVLRAVLMVLTCLSMNHLDLGKCREDVGWAMGWHVRNSMSLSDAKGGPLSVDSDMGGPYCEISSRRCMHRDWADFDVTLKTKGYLLKTLHMIRYS